MSVTKTFLGCSLLACVALSCGDPKSSKPAPSARIAAEKDEFGTYFGGTTRQKNAIYYGGNILTIKDSLDDISSKIKALVVKDGIIEYLGSQEEAFKNYPDYMRIDLKGSTLLPGFFDGHSHFSQVSYQIGAADLLPPNAPGDDIGVKSLNELMAVMRKYQQENPNNHHYMGMNYDHTQFTTGPKDNPKAIHLDSIAKDKPVMVMHQSGHVGTANTKLLELSGLLNVDSSSHIEGGFIEIDAETKRPTGYLEENALIYVAKFIPAPAGDIAIDLLNKSTKEYFKNGFTTVEDGRVFPPTWKQLKDYDNAGLLKIDVVAYPDFVETWKADSNALNDVSKTYKPKSRLRTGGVKLSLDGSPQGRTGWFQQPYLRPLNGKPDKRLDTFRGYPIFPDEDTLKKWINTALSKQWQLIVHCNGDASSDQLIRVFPKNKQSFDHRTTIIHGQFITKEQVRQAKALNMSISAYPLHTFYWGDTHLENLGMDRAQRMSPTKWMLDAGIHFSIHSDAPVIFPHSIPLFVTAIQRKSRHKKIYGIEHRLTPYQALKAMTIEPAYHHFEDGTKGTLEKGKKADFVILDKNPLNYTIKPEEVSLPLNLYPMAIWETIKDGVTVFTSKASKVAYPAVAPK